MISIKVERIKIKRKLPTSPNVSKNIRGKIMNKAEFERLAYDRYIGVATQVKVKHSIDLVIRMIGEDSVRRGIFVSKMLAYINNMAKNNHHEFTDCDVTISEDNRGIYIESWDKGHVINMTFALMSFAESFDMAITTH